MNILEKIMICMYFFYFILKQKRERSRKNAHARNRGRADHLMNELEEQRKNKYCLMINWIELTQNQIYLNQNQNQNQIQIQLLSS